MDPVLVLLQHRYRAGTADTWESNPPFVGSPIYMSPESVYNGVAEEALDLWSVGCVVLEMYAGEPWSEVEFGDLASVLLSGEAPEIPESVPSAARDFLETCFARNPERRGSALGLLLHRFLCEEDMFGLRRLFASLDG